MQHLSADALLTDPSGKIIKKAVDALAPTAFYNKCGQRITLYIQLQVAGYKNIVVDHPLCNDALTAELLQEGIVERVSSFTPQDIRAFAGLYMQGLRFTFGTFSKIPWHDHARQFYFFHVFY